MPYRKIHTSIYAEDWFDRLTYRGKLIFFVLTTSDLTNLAGFSSASVKRLAHDSGLTKTDVLLGLKELEAQCKIASLPEIDLCFLTRFAKWQASGSGGKFWWGVKAVLKSSPIEAQNVFNRFYPTGSPSASPPDGESGSPSDGQSSRSTTLTGTGAVTPARATPFPSPPPGDVSPPATAAEGKDDHEVTDLTQALSLYENNIGPLTPIISQEIAMEFDDHCGLTLFSEAVTEACRRGKRRWGYVRSIVQSCKADGRHPGDKAPPPSVTMYPEFKG